MSAFDPGFDVPLSKSEVDLLLGQPYVPLDLPGLPTRKILVTGAGGSIGRALVRRLLNRGHEVLALDRSEKGLFFLGQRCAEEDCPTLPTMVLQDLGDYARLPEILATHSPDVVIHAAAHKHVGLMELNPDECRRNNVDHSLALFRAAEEANVARFVFLSTDKAVMPTSVMGQTKQEAEKRIASRAASSSMTHLTVRLPNVLGSDGSVIQIFRRQVLLDRPLTLTDDRAERLFISSETACDFIEAGLTDSISGTVIPRHPTKLSICELAHRAHSLWAGKEELVIKTVGLGKGERLTESLLAPGESLLETAIDELALVLREQCQAHED